MMLKYLIGQYFALYVCISVCFLVSTPNGASCWFPICDTLSLNYLYCFYSVVIKREPLCCLYTPKSLKGLSMFNSTNITLGSDVDQDT